MKVRHREKTKKQKMEEVTMNPIICIGNYHIDKKIKELMKVCSTIEIKTPTQPQISNIVKTIIPIKEDELINNIIQFIQGDLRKLNSIYKIYKNKESILNLEIIKKIFHMKSYSDDTKNITQKLINEPYHIDNHLTIMNETDRTIVGLLWHENIIDVIGKMKMSEALPFYLKMLENSLTIFKGSEILHKSTAIEENQRRILLSMVFCDICQEKKNVFNIIYEKSKNYILYGE